MTESTSTDSSINNKRSHRDTNSSSLFRNITYLNDVYSNVKLKQLKLSPDTRTTNDALAYTTTESAVLDLFFGGLVRGTETTHLYNLLEKSWKQDANGTICALLNARDIRGGKGEKAVVMDSLLWLRRYKPLTYILNLITFLQFGYFRDLLILLTKINESNTVWNKFGENEFIELELYAEFLKNDQNKLNKWEIQMKKYNEYKQTQSNNQNEATNNEDENEYEFVDIDDIKDDTTETEEKIIRRPRPLQLSLAAKWAPSEKKSFDNKETKLAKRLSKLLFPSSTTSLRDYRKLLTKLRSHLKLTETKMCTNKWNDINYSQVPSRCHHLMKKAFLKHDQERYSQYLQDLKTGKSGVKINVTGVFPHELVRVYLNNSWHVTYDEEETGETPTVKIDETVEAQWKQIVETMRSKTNFHSCLSVVDVSGSMSGVPMEVSIAFGLLLSELNQCSQYHRKVITFSEKPNWFTITGETLSECVKSISNMDFGYNTNLLSVFDLILTNAIEQNLTSEQLPTTLFIFSDMQFDVAMKLEDNEDKLTTFQTIQSKYTNANYSMPKIIFWNLNGKINNNFPVLKDENNVALLSGYSQEIMKLFIDGIDNINPLTCLEKALQPYRKHVQIEQSEI